MTLLHEYLSIFMLLIFPVSSYGYFVLNYSDLHISFYVFLILPRVELYRMKNFRYCQWLW